MAKSDTTNLADLLVRRSQLRNRGITFINRGSAENFLSYHNLFQNACAVLANLQKRGVPQGADAILQFEDNFQFVTCFWACVLGGINAIPLTAGSSADHKAKLFHIWNKLKRPILISSKEYYSRIVKFTEAEVDLGAKLGDISKTIFFWDDFELTNDNCRQPTISGDDLCLTQFSSGSTGEPKGILLSHENVLSNVNAIARAAQYRGADSMLSWMPLTHDMGLIGFHINPLFCGINQTIISTELFVKRPSIWAQKMHEQRTTITCSPNFGYSYFLKNGRHIENSWDLSCVRIIYNGAEPISESLALEFLTAMHRHSLRSNAIRPVYGLAEATLAVTISDITKKLQSIFVERDSIGIGKKVQICVESGTGVAIVNVGKSIDGCLVHIYDEKGNRMPEGYVGQIKISGSSVTQGYYGSNLSITDSSDGKIWLDTGDLGFILSGCLYVTGRSKDIIFLNGQNFYPHDLEKACEAIEGIELNKIVFAGFTNRDEQREYVVAFALHRKSAAQFVQLANLIRTLISERFGIYLNAVIPVVEIPKTTSGKLQRSKLIDAYQNGAFESVQKELHNAEAVPANVSKKMAPGVQDKLLVTIKQKFALDNICSTTNLFEAGMNSLNLIQVQSLIQEHFGVELPYESFYRWKTIDELTAGIVTYSDKLNRQADFESGSLLSCAETPTTVQQQLYYAWKLDSQSVAYNLPLVFSVKGIVDVEHLQRSILQLFGRNSTLRMRFVNDEALMIEGVRKVTAESIFSIHTSLNLRLEEVLPFLVKPFDMEKALLGRVCLIKCGQGDFLLLDFHHAIIDGISLRYLLDELIAIYDSDMLPNRGDFIRFSLAERAYYESEQFINDQKFWSTKLDGLHSLNIPIDYPRPTVVSNKGAKVEFEFKDQTLHMLQIVAKKEQCTLNVVMLAAYVVLLHKISGQNDLVIGIPVSNRRQSYFQDAIGMFVNTVPIRTKISPDFDFAQWLQVLKKDFEDIMSHSAMPLREIVKTIKRQRDISRHPLFDTSFVFNDFVKEDFVGRQFSLHTEYFDPGTCLYDIAFDGYAIGDVLKFNLTYSTKLFSPDTVENLIESFKKIVCDISSGVQKNVSLLGVKRKKPVVSFERDESDTTITALIESNVVERPSAVAIIDNGIRFTFVELWERVDVLSKYLVSRGISRNDIVGIFIERSSEFIFALLAVQKSCACFLPIDHELPTERIKFIIKDSRCSAIVTISEFYDVIQPLTTGDNSSLPIFNIDLLLSDEKSDSECGQSCPDDLAYVMYTSGTTGNPKGVMIEQHSIVNYLLWAKDTYVGSSVGLCFPFFTSVSFDLTLTSILLPLTTGNTILVYKEVANVLPLSQVIMDNKSDIIKLTPSHLQLMIANGYAERDVLSNIKAFIVGGEQLNSQLAHEVKKCVSKDVVIYNEYGPTEATIGCMIHKFDESENCDSVPIGKAISNTSIFILDQNLQPVSDGAEGEIFIGGAGVARGYLHNEVLTSEKFVSLDVAAGLRCYKTGDIGRVLGGGLIKYVGRVDQQVKINGYRVELREIEFALKRHPEIKDVAVAKEKLGTAPVIVVYYVASRTSLLETDLYAHLSKFLPHYMMPADIRRVETIWLNRNGKVDWTKLSESFQAAPAESDQIFSARELAIVETWQEVLGISSIKVHDNFFALGGDSIKALQIASRLQTRSIFTDARDILSLATPRNVAAAIKDRDESAARKIISTSRRTFTPIEKWFFSRDFKNLNAYNQFILLECEMRLSQEVVSGAISAIVAHHDGLRVNFNIKEAIAYVNSELLSVQPVIERVVLNNSVDYEGLLDQWQRFVHADWDISRDLLVKGILIEVVPTNRQYLFIVAHHLVMDGVSWRILLQDFEECCRYSFHGSPVILPHKSATAIEWQQGHDLNRQSSEELFDYWRSITSVQYSLLTDHKTADWSFSLFAQESIFFSNDQTSRFLKGVHSAYKADAEIVLLSTLTKTFFDWTSQKRFKLFIEGHGRYDKEVDMSRTIGWFTCIYPLLLELYGTESVEDIVFANREQIKQLRNPSSTYATEVVAEQDQMDILFNYLGQVGHEGSSEIFSMPNAKFQIATDPRNTMPFKLEFNLVVLHGQLKVFVGYNSSSYEKASILKLLGLFSQNLEEVMRTIASCSNSEPARFFTGMNDTEMDLLFN